VKPEVYEKLKSMGVGIGRGVEILVKSRKKQFEEQIQEVSEVGDSIAGALLSAGVFDIKIAKTGINAVSEKDDIISIRGFIDLKVPNEESRQTLLELIRNRVEGEADVEA
jgi:hypothetical protein